MAKVIKNEPVKGHTVDLMLDCKHIINEPCEAAIFEPKIGEWRYCTRCKEQKKIIKVDGIRWE